MRQVVTVGELIDSGEASIQTGPFGTQFKAAEYRPSGTPMINVKNIGDGVVRTQGLERVGPETRDRLSAHVLEPGDIVFGRKGAVERHAFIGPDQQGWMQGSDCIRLRLRAERFRPRFVSYAFLTPQHRQWMTNQCSHGATMSSLNQDILRRIELQAVPIESQEKIVALLQAYDDLVDKNRGRLALLEEMSQTIYREWFVSFRVPGSGPLQTSSETQLPEEWYWTTLDEFGDSLVDGDWIETKDQGGHDYRLLQVSNIGIGSYRDTGNYRYITAETFERLHCTEVRIGDILISRMPDPIGRAWLVDHLDERAITSVDVAILSPPSSSAGLYLSRWLNQPSTLQHADTLATGTTRKRISRSVLSKVQLPRPTQAASEGFSAAVSPVNELMTLLRRQTAVAQASRDLLLPKLLSGEIDMSELDIDTSWLAA